MISILKNIWIRHPFRQHGALISISSIIVILQLNHNASNLLAYSRFDIALGQWWRFFTGGMTHSNAWHLSLNLLALWLLYFLFDVQHRKIKAFMLLIICNLSVNACIWYRSVDTYHYLGLSGTLHALFSFGAILTGVKHIKYGWILYGGGCLKILAEQQEWFTQGISQALIATPIHYDAHAYGFVIGTLYGFMYLLFNVFTRSRAT